MDVDQACMKEFESINKAYNDVFSAGGLSIGIVVPIEQYGSGPVPSMTDHLQRVRQVDRLGFKALWVRDIPLNVPSFGDAGQTFDPFTYLGYLAGQTENIALGVASIALPLHHPAHVAKSAASIDQLSNGRLLLGVASGDRFEEYPALGFDFQERGEYFRAAFEYIRTAAESFPTLANNSYGELPGTADFLPKPTAHKIPMLITGHSRQSLVWNAVHADGWMNYPRNLPHQQESIRQWRALMSEQSFGKPFMQPLYVMLSDRADAKPQAIPLGFRIGIKYLADYFHQLREIGVNHVAINLRFQQGELDKALEQLAEELFPIFHHTQKETLSA